MPAFKTIPRMMTKGPLSVALQVYGMPLRNLPSRHIAEVSQDCSAHSIFCVLVQQVIDVLTCAIQGAQRHRLAAERGWTSEG